MEGDGPLAEEVPPGRPLAGLDEGGGGGLQGGVGSGEVGLGLGEGVAAVEGLGPRRGGVAPGQGGGHSRLVDALAGPGGVGQGGVGVDPEQAAQQFLAPARRQPAEGVGLALHQEGGVDEGVVVVAE